MSDHSSITKPADRPDINIKKTNKSNVLYIWLSVFLIVLISFTYIICKYPLFIKAFCNFITVPKDQISSNNGKINVLIMGKSGGSHDGPDLTDSMILASISLTDSYIKTVSIPRDIWIPDLQAKINSSYYWGKTGSAYIDSTASGGGIGLAKKITSEVTGVPVQYGVVVDFSSFKDIVDALGGITVNVENTFTDKLYPIDGRENDTCGGKDPTYSCRYESISFNAGNQFMDGITALKFVRSRHAEGIEGTDIAREARQQKVIEAIKDKITKPSTYLSIKRDLILISIAEKYIETDINLPSAGILARYVLKGIHNVSQLTIPEDLLVVPKTGSQYDNLYVFIPKAGNGKWIEINKWFASNFN